jgi:uncharacterized membrane protein YphA (DoxX/SURF4 family)
VKRCARRGVVIECRFVFATNRSARGTVRIGSKAAMGGGSRAMGGTAIHVARLFLGVCFLVFGGSKIFGGEFLSPGFVADWARKQIEEGHVYSFYVPFLENVVIPNGRVFAFAVAFGEFILGISLVSGALLRPFGFLGILLLTNIALCSVAPEPGASVSAILGGTLQFTSLILLLFVIATNAEAARARGGGKGKKKKEE